MAFPKTNGLLENKMNGFYKPVAMLRDVSVSFWFQCFDSWAIGGLVARSTIPPLPLQTEVWCTTRARVVCGTKWRKGR